MALTESAAEDVVSDEQPRERQRERRAGQGTRGRRRAYVMLGLLFVAAIAWFVVEMVRWSGAKAPASGAEAVAAARTQALNLMTLNYKTVTRDLQRVIDGSTGEMRTQYKKALNGTASKVTAEKSVSTGTILAAGLTSLQGDTADVLVAGDATVAFPKSAKTAASRIQVHYRFQIEMKQVAGGWKSSLLNFAGLPNVTQLPAS